MLRGISTSNSRMGRQVARVRPRLAIVTIALLACGLLANAQTVGTSDFFNGATFGSPCTFYYLTFASSGGSLFGCYSIPSTGFILHADLGAESVTADPSNLYGLYLYDFPSQHYWWTSTAEFPYIYDFTLSAWLYYFPDPAHPGHYTSNPRYFSNLTTGVIFTMPALTEYVRLGGNVIAIEKQ